MCACSQICVSPWHVEARFSISSILLFLGKLMPGYLKGSPQTGLPFKTVSRFRNEHHSCKRQECDLALDCTGRDLQGKRSDMSLTVVYDACSSWSAKPILKCLERAGMSVEFPLNSLHHSTLTDIFTMKSLPLTPPLAFAGNVTSRRKIPPCVKHNCTGSLPAQEHFQQFPVHACENTRTWRSVEYARIHLKWVLTSRSRRFKQQVRSESIFQCNL